LRRALSLQLTSAFCHFNCTAVPCHFGRAVPFTIKAERKRTERFAEEEVAAKSAHTDTD
jgi:hypothetical protein